MKKWILMMSLTLPGTAAFADDVRETDRLLCSNNQVLVCVHSVECLAVPNDVVETPQFVVIDTKKKTISTTKGSGQQGSSKFTSLSREGGLIMAQGARDERVFSFVIDEATGTFTGSVASDGYTINSFGACTDADVD